MNKIKTWQERMSEAGFSEPDAHFRIQPFACAVFAHIADLEAALATHHAAGVPEVVSKVRADAFEVFGNTNPIAFDVIEYVTQSIFTAAAYGCPNCANAGCDDCNPPLSDHWKRRLQELMRENSKLRAMLAATPPAPDAGKVKRATWKTDGGFKCLNCGKSIIDHEEQTFCPAPAAQAPAGWSDESATKRLRSIVDLLGLQSVVPDGDLTGYEFAVLGFVRHAIEQLKAAPAGDARDAVLALAKQALENSKSEDVARDIERRKAIKAIDAAMKEKP